MLTYSHRDALLCAPCAEFVALNDRRKPRPIVLGAYDCPQHCERCGVFLRNALTETGREFVLRMCAVNHDALAPGVRFAVASWRAFYVLS
jgi:hypothetical protein